MELAELSVKTGRLGHLDGLPNASPGAFRLLDKASARASTRFGPLSRAYLRIVFQVTLAERIAVRPGSRRRAFAEVLSVPAAERARFYRDPAWRDRARADVKRQWYYTFDPVFVQETTVHPELADKPMREELAARRGVDPLDVLCDVALDDDLATRFRVVVANDDAESLAGLLRDDRTLLGLSGCRLRAREPALRCGLLHLSAGALGPGDRQHAGPWRRLSGGSPGILWRCSALTWPGSGWRRGISSPTWVAFDPAAVGVEPMERVYDLLAGAPTAWIAWAATACTRRG